MPVSTTHTRRKPKRKTRSRRKQTAHVVIDDTPVRVRRRKTSRSVARSRSGARQLANAGAEYVVLPSWKDLDKATNGRVVAPKSHPFDSISTARIALAILVVAVVATAYVGHVQSTQGILQTVEALRAEKATLHLEYNSVKGEYDRLTGPAAIRDQARDIGLIETTEYGKTVTIGT